MVKKSLLDDTKIKQEKKNEKGVESHGIVKQETIVHEKGEEQNEKCDDSVEDVTGTVRQKRKAANKPIVIDVSDSDDDDDRDSSNQSVNDDDDVSLGSTDDDEDMGWSEGGGSGGGDEDSFVDRKPAAKNTPRKRKSDTEFSKATTRLET